MEMIFSLSVLALAPGDPMGSLNVFRPPGPMGPRGVQGPHLRPDMPMHFQGPGGPRQGPPIGPLFPGPEGPMMGPRMRGHMPLRMQGGPGVGRGMPTGPRPLLPEMVSFVCIQFLHRFFLYCKAFFSLDFYRNRRKEAFNLKSSFYLSVQSNSYFIWYCVTTLLH